MNKTNYKFLESIAQQISAIADNSANVVKDCAFVAIKGEKFDGHNFIEDAIKLGAKYIIYENTNYINNQNHNINFIQVANTRSAPSFLSSYFYTQQPKKITAITGTNGKSSTVSFFEQIMTLAGKRAGSIGTLGCTGFSANSNLTTPDPITLYSTLQEAARQSVEFLALEASSHGLKQRRLDALKLYAAGFTNFTQDHLDYHQNMEDYFESKMILFTDILQKGFAVLNADIPEYDRIRKICLENNHTITDYGRKAKQIKILKITNTNCQQHLELELEGNYYKQMINLIGEFQIYNLLCAAGFAMAAQVTPEEIISFFPKIKPVCGRMDKIKSDDFHVYVDYAHTPDALERALLSLRPFTSDKIVLVFGCGGDRDKEKRPLMGKIAAELADQIIITDDNPRNEDPAEIRQQIYQTCPSATIISDRALAIKNAVNSISKGDILLIAGKGHETYQIIGKEKTYFSDHEIADKAIKEKILQMS